MAISFNNIPSNIRVPLFYAEVDNVKEETYTTEIDLDNLPGIY